MWAIIESWSYVVVLVSAAAVGVLAMWVTFHEPRTEKAKYIWLAVFTALSAVGITAAIVDHHTLEQANANTNAKLARVDEKVDIIYQLSATSNPPRPTAEQQAAIDKWAKQLKGQRDKRLDLKSELKLLSAEMLQFVSEREANAPPLDVAAIPAAPVLDLVEMMHRPLDPKSPSFEEIIEQRHRELSILPVDMKYLAPSEADASWLDRNLPAINYYYQTRILYGQRFGRRVSDIVDGPPTPGQHMPIVSDKDWDDLVLVVARLRAADNRLYPALQTWLRTCQKPGNVEALVKNEATAATAYNQWLVKNKALIAKATKGSTVAGSIYNYPTNLTAMRTLALQLNAVADEIP